ncbi:MAG: OadG family transporter subunit [Candidatus Spyradocola sp.]|nr:OadG family transporter subunit [Candidatus Spyradocola sp.]
MYFTASIDPQVMSGAGIVFAVGFGIVFVTLILLILVLTLQAWIFKSLGNRGRKAKAPAAKAAPAPAPVPAPAPAPAAAQEDEDEIAAVIAAVVAMMSESGNGLVVRSVRRVGSNTPAWSASGRQEYVNTRY